MQFVTLSRACRQLRGLSVNLRTSTRLYPGDEFGRGAGKGGGSGGSIREAGGAFGKMEAAREEEYFKKLQARQIIELKERLNKEVSHHEHEIKTLYDSVERHKKRIKELREAKKDADRDH